MTMSKNPKVTIALAFVLTFLLGTGAGYLLCGTMHPYAGGTLLSEAEDIAGAERIAPAPPPADAVPDTDVTGEPIAPEWEQRDRGEQARSGDRAGQAAGEGAGAGQGYRNAAELTTDGPDRETVDEEARTAEEPASRRSVGRDAATETETVERTVERRYRNQVERSQDTTEVVEEEQDQEPRRRLWRSRSGDQETAYTRVRERLVRELELSEEVAESFFTILESHRRQVREEVVIPQRELHQRHRELSELLESELSEVLSEEQMETWRERFAPRMDRGSRDESDRRNWRDRNRPGEEDGDNAD